MFLNFLMIFSPLRGETSILRRFFERGEEKKDSVVNNRIYLYDGNGNILNTMGSRQRQYLWDEENRPMGISDNVYMANYLYDASGEHTVKLQGARKRECM